MALVHILPGGQDTDCGPPHILPPPIHLHALEPRTTSLGPPKARCSVQKAFKQYFQFWSGNRESCLMVLWKLKDAFGGQRDTGPLA